MDPFTQRMLERTKMRREKLDQHFSKELELGIRQPLSEKKSFSSLNRDNQNMEDDIFSKASCDIDCHVDNQNLENEVMYDQINKSEKCKDSFHCEDQNRSEKRPHKFGKLAELATKIKEWEDELDKPKQCGTSLKTMKSSDNKRMRNDTEKLQEPIKPLVQGNKSDKQVIWDKAVIKSLESQGYALSKNESRLIYDFEDVKKVSYTGSKLVSTSSVAPDSNSTKEVGTVHSCDNSPRKKNDNKDSVVLKKAAFFESRNRSSPNKVEKDPIQLSISERKAIFEKNGGQALLPKVAFASPLPAKLAVVSKPDKGTEKTDDQVSQRLKIINTSYKKEIDSEMAIKNPIVQIDKKEKENNVQKRKENFEKATASVTDDSPLSAVISSHKKEPEYIKKSLDHKNVSQEYSGSIPEPPPMPSTSISSSKKDINIEDCGEKKLDDSRRLYPSLSEFEESDDSDHLENEAHSFNESKNSNIYLNMSFSDILEAKRNETSSSEHSFNADMGESQVLSKMDEFLDNALNDLSSTDDYDSEDENAPSPPKMIKSSSFEFKGNNQGTSVNSLVHTVSFYRKQQQTSSNTQSSESGKSIKREENAVQNAVVEEEGVLVEKKVQELLQEINRQQTIISQASQALNLCLSTVEFSNSGEQVESERLLLLANHKRQACLNEIQRLKVENTIHPCGSKQLFTERGDVIISNICLPLKRDSLRAMATVESMQYIVCLIKSDERVVATPAVPATRDNMKNMVLCFPGQYKLEKLLSDFKVTVEVYNLELSKEMLPHEVKYHIVNKKEKKLLTPIKSKKADSRLVMPCVQNPAGPNAVRSSNFHLCGYLVFSLREVSRTNWTLNKVPYTSPLEGSFSMQIQSQLQLDAEFRGFLTMFDDISGFGAWHRRWCLLSSHTLSYWKYPDDETRKVPIGTIDLRGVVTENIGLVSRDICARLHTFLLETTRPKNEDDKESLVLNVQGNITRIRHLLSADSKEEMLSWCHKLNNTLALLRSWRCNFDA